MKKQACIYVDTELLKFAHEKRLNVSGIANNALKEFILEFEEEFETNSADLMLVSQKGSDNSGSEEIRTPDLRRVKATSYH